ncbi:MAG: radical SAM family heme chaperone HemW [Chloroflexi bacterium]|nr:radical SAM family heme chaperone HemW [Chloroflexota bacterium]
MPTLIAPRARAPVYAERWPAPAAVESSAGLYIHVPFCARLCPYCDFDTQDRELHLIAPYARALVAEVQYLPAVPLHSVFFGGGTPSVLRPEQVAAVLDAIRARLSVAPDAEITIECNPNHVREARLAGYRAAGVNRISLGVQALDEALLRLLGRQHTVARVVAAVAAVRAAGFDDLSLDLMYGLPGQSLAQWERTVDAALALEPTHLSAYLLTLEPWTPMGQAVARGELTLPDDETVAAQYALLGERLAAAGFVQYEISNWARPGWAGRHNLGYWRGEPYLALGAGAVGRWGAARRKTTPLVPEYLRAVGEGTVPPAAVEPLTPEAQWRELLMLGLRLRAGIDPAAFQARTGLALEQAMPAADELMAGGFLEWAEGRLRLTARALLVSNEVLVRLGLAAGD